MVVVSSTFSAPSEGILKQQPSVKLIVNDQELGTGDLYITENNVIWGGGALSAGGAAPTISLPYPSISLHAIQREPSPALYLVLNYELTLPELITQATEDEEFDAENMPITQLRFIPQNEADLSALYSAMTEGQSLHPDPQDSVDEDDPYLDVQEFDEGDDEFEDAQDAEQPEDPAARLRRLRLEISNGNQHSEDNEDEDIAE